MQSAPMTRIAVVLALSVALVAMGFLTAGSVAGGGTQANATVALRKTKLGMILVSSRGRTLYLFAKDRNGRSACSASCARFWPPLLVSGKPTAGTGVKRLLLGTTRRANGSMQVTYNKHPLYTYRSDTAAGQTKGQGSTGFGARWWAVSAAGRAVVTAPPATPPPPPPTYPPPPYPPAPNP